MTRNEMMTAVSRKFGLENKWTIWFYRLAESSISEEDLKMAFDLVKCASYLSDDEDIYETS